MIREFIALVALAVSGLFSLSLFCIALIVSAWNSRYFLGRVWAIALAWFALSITA